MFAKRLTFFTLAAAVVGLPYLLSSSTTKEQQGSGAVSQVPDGQGTEPPVAAKARASTPPGQNNAPLTQAEKPAPRSQRGSDPRPETQRPQALRPEELFDPTITPQWVRQHWSQISTVTDQVRWLGYRVTVVTGTAAEDLAGSLTYYFDAKGRLRRIRFRGTTGQPRRLISVLEALHGLRRVQSVSASVWEYRRRWDARRTSWLRIRPASRLDASRPHQHYHVELQLELPARQRLFAPAEQNPPRIRL